MPLGPARLDHGQGPVGDVLLKCRLLLLDVEPGNSGENVDWFFLMRSPLELPGLPHHEDRHHFVPLSIFQPAGVIQHPVRDGQAALLPPLDQDIISVLDPPALLSSVETYFKSYKISLALNMVMRLLGAAGMMMMEVLLCLLPPYCS